MHTKDFEYDGERLSDHGFIICSFNGEENIDSLSSGADIVFNQVKSSMSHKFNLYSCNYESSYICTFQICKNPCTSNNNLYISTEEVSALQQWLCRNKYHKFKLYQDGYKNLYWMSVFSTKQIMQNGKIVGLELTMYTDAPYAHFENISLEFDCKKNEKFYVYSASDEEGYIYPHIEITCLDDNGTDGTYTLELSNSRDKNILKIKGCKKDEIISINGDYLTISSSDNSHSSLPNDFNYYFPKIFNTYKNNQNIFACNIDCFIRFTYSPVRRIGL